MPRIEVRILNEDLAELAGEPLVPQPPQSMNDAVLDELHRYARRCGADVEATVVDRPAASRFILRMSPDGSSRLLTSGDLPATRETRVGGTPSALALAVARATAAADAFTPAPAIAATPPGNDSPDVRATGTPAVAAEPGDAVEAHTHHAATDVTGKTAGTLCHSEEDIPIPAELVKRIGHIHGLASEGRFQEAFAKATILRKSLTVSLGAEHAHTLEVRALEAYLAHLAEDHREATVLALAVARSRCVANDARAAADATRATAAWQWLEDHSAVVTHGQELLHMWRKLKLRGVLSAEHEEIAELVRQDMDALATLP
ncbi:hypothetical protein O3S80_42365 [Streptomyces sp. Lzd4kr]|nr:hypothetical protein [Streptomyces sp. Lzd4kr]